MPVIEKLGRFIWLNLVSNGVIIHRNDSFWWQDWEDVVGENAGPGSRDSYKLQMDSTQFLTGIVESRWQTGNSEDGRVYVKTRASP